MEKELNIAAILKDKPQGTKLYDWLYNIDIELDTISTTDTETVVWCTNETDNNTTCHRGYSEFGTVRNCPNGLQILLPSRGMRDWSKFAWKKGDVLVSNDRDRHIIFKGFSKNDYTTFEGKHWISVSKKRYISCLNVQNTQGYHIEDDKDAAQTYINTVEERFGGKLNLETLEIGKQTKFKDGDIVVVEGDNKDKKIFILHYKIRDRNTDEHGYKSYINVNSDGSLLNNMTFYHRKDFVYRPATDSEKQQLFDALAKEGKRWNPDTKQTEDLPKKCEFKPMDWCLMKYKGHYNNRGWELCQYAYTEHRVSICYKRDFYHAVGGEIYAECIPYNDQTKHLLGTTDDWKGGEG